MTDLFLTILNMSITASYIAIAVILFRFFLKKAPKSLMVIMWALVGIRLVLPFSFESIFSTIPSAKTIPENIIHSSTPHIDSGITILNQAVNPIISESFTTNQNNSVNTLENAFSVAAIVWIVGITAMLIYTLVSYLKISFKVREAVKLKDNIYLCDNIASPFIFGIIRPKIYLPSNINESDIEFVTAHEKAHIKRLDHIWKPLGFALLSIYWFNPILLFAYILLCKDIEFACDEAVIKKMGTDIKKPYSEALLNCSVSKRLITACPLAFGETGVKSRIKSVLNYKKPTFWIIAVALISCIVLSVCFLTNPKSTTITYIEGSDFSRQIDDTISVMKTIDGSGFKKVSTVDKTILKQLFDIEISKNPISNDRSDYFYRDHTNTLVLIEVSDLTPSLSSSLQGFYVCFNKDFTEVFVCGKGFKTTLSYRVKAPEKAKHIFDKFSTDIDYHNWKSYDEYLGLPTDKGLEVYVWMDNSGLYKSVLKSGKNLGYTDNEIFSSRPAPLATMRTILSSYDIPQEKITIIPKIHPDYNVKITKEDEKVIKFDLFGLASYNNLEFDDWGLKMSLYLLDNDYFQVAFEHSPEHQKVIGKFTTSPAFELRAIHNDKVISFGDYMRNVLNQKDYEEKVLAWDCVLYTLPSGEVFTLTDSFKLTYGDLPVGEYVLCKEIRFEDANGNFKIRTYTAPFSVVD